MPNKKKILDCAKGRNCISEQDIEGGARTVLGALGQKNKGLRNKNNKTNLSHKTGEEKPYYGRRGTQQLAREGNQQDRGSHCPKRPKSVE